MFIPNHADDDVQLPPRSTKSSSSSRQNWATVFDWTAMQAATSRYKSTGSANLQDLQPTATTTTFTTRAQTVWISAATIFTTFTSR